MKHTLPSKRKFSVKMPTLLESLLGEYGSLLACSLLEVPSFSQIEEIMQNKAVPLSTKIAAASRLENIPFTSDVLDFLGNEEIHPSVKILLSLGLKQIPLTTLLKLLEKSMIPLSTKIAAASRLENIPFTSDVLDFLGNEEIHPSIQAVIVSKFTFGKEVKILDFTDRISDLPLLVREVFWAVLPIQRRDIAQIMKSTLSLSEKQILAKRARNSMPSPELSFGFQRMQHYLYTGKRESKSNAISGGNEDFEKQKTIIALKLHKQTEPISASEYGIITGNSHFNSSTREKHAVAVNRYQLSLLQWKNHFKIIPNKRNLIFYYRKEQGAFDPHYIEMVRFLKWYIASSGSPLYTDIKIALRDRSSLLHAKNIFGGEDSDYISEEGPLFQAKTSVFSDMIHLNHGTPEKTPGSLSIVGDAIASDPEKYCPSYIPLHLLYFGGSNYTTIYRNYKGILPGGNELGFPMDKSIREILSELFDAIRCAELTQLKNAGI